MSEVKKYEASAPKQFFTVEDWLYPGLLPELPYNDLLSGIVYTPSTIVNALKYAQHFLENVPGPNLDFRREHTNNWLGWWIKELSKYCGLNYSYMKTYNVIDPVHLSDIFEQSFKRDDLIGFHFESDHILSVIDNGYANEQHIVALWFVAGLEGHEGHRYAIDFVLNSCKKKGWLPVIMFEDPEFIQRKERLGEFLPIELRISMMSHYLRMGENKGIITINPERSVPEDSLDEYYRELFKTMKGSICFTNRSDRDGVYSSKFFRGDFSSPDTLIPNLDCPSTTDRVRI